MSEERWLRGWKGLVQTKQGWDAGGATGCCSPSTTGMPRVVCSGSRTREQNQHLCPSELQFFKMGIAMCFIEMRGSTIREAKSRSFELITSSKTFRYPGGRGDEEGGAFASRAWALLAAAAP